MLSEGLPDPTALVDWAIEGSLERTTSTAANADPGKFSFTHAQASSLAKSRRDLALRITRSPPP
jgi:hypothetical protein